MSALAVVVMPYAAHTTLPWGLVAAFSCIVIAAVFVGQTFGAARTRRIFWGVSFAALVAVGVPLSAVICSVCLYLGCDPWWLEYFWICV